MPPGPHPHFNDQRTADWHRTLPEGLAAARESGRRLLVQVGRITCGGSRALVERVVPKEEIAEVLQGQFICVSLDADDPAPEVAALLAQLPRREPTPVCVYLSPEGRVVHSTVGGRPPAVFLRDLTEALAKE